MRVTAARAVDELPASRGGCARIVPSRSRDEERDTNSGQHGGCSSDGHRVDHWWHGRTHGTGEDTF